MAETGRATAFVTGAEGFLGTELVNHLVAHGHPVVALASSLSAADHLRRAGAIPVLGDLATPGRWQDEVVADWIFHLPSRAVDRRGALPGRAASRVRTRVLTDANLLDAVEGGRARRIVYVADPRCYGAAGRHPLTEDEPPRPTPSGRWQIPALDRLDGYVLAGLPIVTAIPGCVYGAGSWFRQLLIDPVMDGRRVLQFGRTGPLVSPIHAHDCVRALVHLATHGGPGQRYFVAGSELVRMNEVAKTVARLANRPLRVRRLPAAAARFLVGAAEPAYPETDAALSNIRLRGIGFRFEYPTVEEGIRQVLGTIHE